jgi:hypothetical protein
VRARALAPTALALALGACGYRPARELLADRAPLAVVPGGVFVADAAAVAAAEAGARRALARAGRLASCEPATDAACVHVIVEVLRIEDLSAGIVRGLDGAPTALGLMTRVTARAYLRGAASSPDDDAPIEASATALVGLPSPTAPGGAPLALLARHEAARRAAAQVGEELARRVLFLAR